MIPTYCYNPITMDDVDAMNDAYVYYRGPSF